MGQGLAVKSLCSKEMTRPLEEECGWGMGGHEFLLVTVSVVVRTRKGNTQHINPRPDNAVTKMNVKSSC